MSMGIEIHNTASISVTRRRRSPAPVVDIVEFGVFTCRCPSTHEPVDSGIEMDRQTFRKIGKLFVRVPCRSCRDTHLVRVASGELSRRP